MIDHLKNIPHYFALLMVLCTMYVIDRKLKVLEKVVFCKQKSR